MSAHPRWQPSRHGGSSGGFGSRRVGVRQNGSGVRQRLYPGQLRTLDLLIGNLEAAFSFPNYRKTLEYQ